MVRWRCHTHGRATHSSQPHLGDNAIYRMARVLAALERYAREVVAQRSAEHPLCGKPTLSVGTIIGGLSVNTVPDRVTIEIDRRLDSRRDSRTRPIARWSTSWRPSWAPIRHVEHEQPLSDRLRPVRRPQRPAGRSDVGRRRRGAARRQCVGVPYGTNAAAIAAAGVPSIVFGPGSIDQAHTADEWLEVEQFEARQRSPLPVWLRSDVTSAGLRSQTSAQ